MLFINYIFIKYGLENTVRPTFKRKCDEYFYIDITIRDYQCFCRRLQGKRKYWISLGSGYF